MKTDAAELKTVLVTDCGSTTTKALLFEKTDEGWRQTCRGEAPTTVEAPVADVTVGVLNAFQEVQELSGREIIKSEAKPGELPIQESSSDPASGVDLYLSTSSAGGGLQMLVAGVVKQMTAESAQRAALGAGAIVMDTLCADDGREDHERIERIRHLKPDIVLLTGGVDGGAKSWVIELAETILAAAPRPRFGETLKLPVIYAGNREAAADVRQILDKLAQVIEVANVRPSLEREELGPAREAIHEMFLTHVMSHSPGYGKLLSWSPFPVMPTPAAVGDMVSMYSRETGQTVLCADIGGATTDVFSTFKNRSGEFVFNRTVSANLGMSYSVANVLIEAGPENIARWLPYELDQASLRDRLRNKMIRPTSIPQTLEDLWLEQAVCREALRLSLEHHRSLAVGLSGVTQQRGIADLFTQEKSRYELVDLLRLDLVIGSGGVLSHAPQRLGAALMMLDGFELRGITQLAVDSIFMLPHLGVLSALHPQAAKEIFLRDCLVNIGHSVVPVYRAAERGERDLLLVRANGKEIGVVRRGEIQLINFTPGEEIELSCEPLNRRVEIGAGPGQPVKKRIKTGLNGLILDGRNRPIEFAQDSKERQAKQREIFETLGLL